MKRPNFQSIFEKKSDFCERSSQKPIETLIPGQAIKLSELIARFNRGQRLNVHANFTPGSNFLNITDEEALEIQKNDNMDPSFFPPVDVHDVVDVEREYHEQQIHKREFAERQKKKKQSQPATTQGEAQQEQPDDPAK